MKAHFRGSVVKIDQTSFGLMGVAGKLTPSTQHSFWHLWPWFACFRVKRLIPIARRVRYPPERAEIRHSHRKRLSRSRKSGDKQRGDPHNLTNLSKERLLLSTI